MWEQEQLPGFTFSPFTIDFPKRITWQPAPSMVSSHPTRARAHTLVTVPVPDTSPGVSAAPKPQCSREALTTCLLLSITPTFWPMP